MADDDDIRDAAFFRLWIDMAAKTPARMASALANCIYADDYRLALTKIAMEERINLPVPINPNGPFSAGDKVRHFAGNRGVVTDISSGIVTVSFNDGWTGKFDPLWFRSHPKGLSIVTDEVA